MTKSRSVCMMIALLGIMSVGAAQDKPPAHLLGQSGTTVVPSTFLRGYDPITVFFSQPEGPGGNKPCDQPGALLEITPAHPGEYRWLDAKTLQFLPTIPWPALERFTVKAKGSQFELVTFMLPPVGISPGDGSHDLEPFRDINLTFPGRIGAAKLAQMLTFDVRPLPGTGDGEAYRLTSKDFVVKEIERSSLKDEVQYQVTFHQALSFGVSITMNIRLAASDKIPGTMAHYNFATVPTFRLSAVGARSVSFPVAARGSMYTRDQALDCGDGADPLFLEFTGELGSISLAEIKQLVRFEPAVRNFRFSHGSGKRLQLYFDAEPGKLYQLRLADAPIRDRSGRQLASLGETGLYFYYRPAAPFIRWRAAQGILERFGPQQLPMEVRGETQVDLRLYKIDPLSRNFWPFPPEPVQVNESTRPPGPGEEPDYATQMVEQIKLLGSPLVSRLVALPAAGRRGQLRFGLDLKEHLAVISGKDQPGTYLVGYRPLGTGSRRFYARVQVTDLDLTTVEEESAVTFVVTSLQNCQPVVGAKVEVEGFRGGGWTTLISGVTNSAGRFRYEHRKRLDADIRRINVQNGGDVLVLDTASPPPHYLDNHWYGAGSKWLGWLNNDPVTTKDDPVWKAHLLTERPVYRPEEPVHLKGYLRQRQHGLVKRDPKIQKLELAVEGPGDKVWVYSVAVNQYGGFYHLFNEKDLPTGDFRALVRFSSNRPPLAQVTFKKEAYRIPLFEVTLEGPDKTPMDEPFTMLMTANYYAGGHVVGQDVAWRVTQFPYTVETKDYPGFLFSSSDRFTGGGSFKSSGVLTKKDVSDETGSSKLVINPGLEEDARARQYAVEVTVRGADEQTVTNTKRVVALPAFVVGLKTERFIKGQKVIHAETLVLGHDGEPLAGKEFQLKLYQRQWHSVLAESDFTTGQAKYVTDVVDKPIMEKALTSTAAPMAVDLPVSEAGIYVVEISAADKLGRLQKVTADLYVAGETPVSWKKPKANVFDTALDKEKYNPGDTANLVLKSPFQQAQALVVVEGPAANSYHWVEVMNGQGLFSLPITGDMTPRVPVHAILFRGRLSDAGDVNKDREDRGRPIAMAGTTWVVVNPGDNQLQVGLEHPEKALPATNLPVKILLKDPAGRPLNGEVALWLVDRAVLALGKEKPLDPLASFIDETKARLRFRDTRNSVVGNLSIEEMSGGGGEEGKKESLFENVTVRKNFKTVPYFNPSIEVVGGVATVNIALPDNLTEFAVRAVATDGATRFGAAKSMVAVRLPLIVLPALPRFVRPGDQFKAGGIGRVVEGSGGPGSCQIQVERLELQGEATRPVTWAKDRPERLYFPLKVPSADVDSVTVRLAVKRDADGVKDAFEIKLPVRRDTARRRLEVFTRLKLGETLAFPKPDEPARPGNTIASAVITSEPALIKMLAGLNYLATYEYGCTEQRISRMLPELALKDVLGKIGRDDRSEANKLFMQETFRFLETVQRPDGLFSYWPGSDTRVGLTAYVVEFLYLAKQQGYNFRKDMLDRGINALKASLRSDYSNFIDGYSFVERAEALTALALCGQFEEGYGRDLLARAMNMDLYSEAKIMRAFLTRRSEQGAAIERLGSDLSRSLVFKLREGKEAYQGLQYRGEGESWGGLINSSEVKTMASVCQALYQFDPKNSRTRLLVAELVGRGEGDGWGSTNANAAALMALGEVFKTSVPPAKGHQFSFSFGAQASDTKSTSTEGKMVTRMTTTTDAPVSLTHTGGDPADVPFLWLSTDFIPATTGDQVKAKNEGFVVERELLLIKSDDQPPVKVKVVAGKALELETGAIVEEHVRLINAVDNYYVAITAPFAAGLEPLNPKLLTSPPEAKPSGDLTMPPSYAMYEDDKVSFFYDQLPKGTYDFYFRLRAMTEGSYSHPPAKAELMYKQTVRGRSDGMRIVVKPRS